MTSHIYRVCIYKKHEIHSIRIHTNALIIRYCMLAAVLVILSVHLIGANCRSVARATRLVARVHFIVQCCVYMCIMYIEFL